MANSESIRNLLIGRETTVGTLAGTMNHIPFLQATHSPKKAILIPKEYRGVRVMDAVALAGVQHSEIKVKTQGYYDLMGWFFLGAFNAPVDAANGAAWDHTFKTGAGSVPTSSLEFSYGVGTAVEIWEKALSCVCNQMDISFAADKLVELDFSYLSNFAAVISAPSIPAFSIGAYVHPWNPPTQSITVAGGGGYPAASLISAKVSIKNGRTPLHTIQTNADPARFLEGAVEIDFDFEADYSADTSSFYNRYFNNVTPGAITINAIDTSSDLGGGKRPTFTLTIPQPRFTSAELKPDSKGNTTVSAKGKGLYDTSSSSALTALLTNALASYPAS